MQGLKLDKFLMFRNQKVKKSQPDFVGTINLDGKIYGIVSWIKTDKKGDQFISGSVNYEIDIDELNPDIPELQTGREL